MSTRNHRYRRANALASLRGPQAEAFRQLTAGLTPAEILVVPLDIGKNVHWAAFHTADGILLQDPVKLRTHRAGYDQFSSYLDAHVATGQFRLVILGHEATGVYHDAWACTLLPRYAALVRQSPWRRAGICPPAVVFVAWTRTPAGIAHDAPAAAAGSP